MKKWYKSRTIIFNIFIFILTTLVFFTELFYGMIDTEIILKIVCFSNCILRLLTKEPIEGAYKDEL